MQFEAHRNWIVDLRDNGGGNMTHAPLLPWMLDGFRVKLVGRPSAGVIDISNLRPHPLPSGRVLKDGTSRSTRAPDMRIDTIGIPPDILLPRPANEAAKAREVAQVLRWLETGSWQRASSDRHGGCGLRPDRGPHRLQCRP